MRSIYAITSFLEKIKCGTNRFAQDHLITGTISTEPIVNSRQFVGQSVMLGFWAGHRLQQ